MSFVAARLAARLYAGRIDRQGDACLDHLTAVVTILRERWPDVPAPAIEAAWLHDAMQDCGATATSLLREGISPEAVRMVEALTKPADAAELDWIAGLAAAGDPWVIRVKLADYAHSSAPARACLEAAERGLRETGLS